MTEQNAEGHEIQQTIIEGETSAIRRVHPEIPEELEILEDIDRDPQRIQWFESRPEDYVPKSKQELIDFAKSDKDHLVYAVSGAVGQVRDEEVGRLQGWVLVKPDMPGHVRDMVSGGLLNEDNAVNPVLEINYAKRSDAAGGQMASAVRQVCIDLAAITQELNPDTQFPPPLTVVAYLINKDPQNTPSEKLLVASGFEEKGKLQYDEAAEKPDRVFILNWQKLMEIENQKKMPPDLI